jgi:putative DNA primase/helicase
MEANANLKNLITNEVLKHVNDIEPQNQTANDILQNLTNSISAINFKLLAFPDFENIQTSINELKPFVYNEDGSINKQNKKEWEQYKELEKKLDSYQLLERNRQRAFSILFG